MNRQHELTSFHASLLVVLAEHHPVASRHLLDDALSVECCCGNPLYTGHLVTLLRRLNEGEVAERERVLGAVRRLHTEWGDLDVGLIDQLELWERLGKILHPTAPAAGVGS